MLERADTTPSAGLKIGRYSVIRPLGAGGMAVVYLCELQGIGGFKKQVVAKLIRPEYAQEQEAVLMFLDEARLSAELNHPNIVQVFEIDSVQGAPYLVMEYVHGPSLWRLARRAEQTGVTPYSHIAYILARISRGLHYAHFRDGPSDGPPRLVHRDVSLQNILVSSEGTPKLIDFGIARAEGRLHATRTGIKGKLFYLSPEQIRGENLDHRSDIYSLGVCLYRATVGRFPHEGSTPNESMRATLRSDLPLNMLPQDYPAALAAVLARALAQSPGDRYQSCAELAEDLDRFCASPGRASGESAISSWIGQEFPKGSEQWLGVSAADSRASLSLLSRSLHPIQEQPRSSLALWMLAGVGVFALVVLPLAAVLVSVLLTVGMRPSYEPIILVPSPVQPLPAPASPPATARGATPEPEPPLQRPPPPAPARAVARPDPPREPQIVEVLEPMPAPEPPAAPPAAPEPALEPPPDARAEVSPPDPAPSSVPEPAPLDRTVGLELPEQYLIRNIDQIKIVLSAIEEHAVRAGVPAGIARGSTQGIASSLIERHTPGASMPIRPRTIFSRILDGAERGESRAGIDAGLTRALERGELR